MMENTLENKSLFFALHLGQNIVSFHEQNHVTRGMNNPSYVSAPVFYYPLIMYTFLELKNLSLISDDDAKEASKILGHKVYAGTKFIQRLIDGSFVQYPMSTTIFLFDFLRSRGYALPWMGLPVETLVEYGWIKLI